MARLILVLLLGLGVSSCTHKSAALQTGRETARLFARGEISALHSKFERNFQRALPLANLRSFKASVDEQFGKECELLDEEVTSVINSGHVYYRDAIYEKFTKPVELVASFTSAGKISGFAVRQKATEAPSKYLNYATKTELRLPFFGQWYVVWGGRSLRTNYHAAFKSQRFALDLVVVKNTSSFAGSGKSLSDYYCFDQSVLSPASGRIAALVDNLPDQQIGKADTANPTGNYVVIDHASGEFSLLAHLRPGSIPLKIGQQIKQGDVIGKCGNSGNTSEPHLHYQLQDHVDLWNGESMPALFVHYLADNKLIESGEPISGQFVGNSK